ncbi:unnamed protein product [Macrosiphum euphorbiae]|uniref:Uncharacterized protein n=1 Tax=Macrosiphum euphorbiae TaxID=13131 RepID=A0AAV0WG15_9HEMI|nr:unnamed protein product [Macrosiphum euphorbiae]
MTQSTPSSRATKEGVGNEDRRELNSTICHRSHAGVEAQLGGSEPVHQPRPIIEGEGRERTPTRTAGSITNLDKTNYCRPKAKL